MQHPALQDHVHYDEPRHLRAVPALPPALPEQPAEALPVLLEAVNATHASGSVLERIEALDHAQYAMAEVSLTLADLRQRLAY